MAASETVEITEYFLHYVWKHRLFSAIDLKTSDGFPVSVIHPGYAHADAGPDFKQSVIRIGNFTWAGDVEIHIKSSDWIRHCHHHNPKYDSVILHVVYENDLEIYRYGNEKYPVLELKDLISPKLIDEYRKLTFSEKKIPCASQIGHIEKLSFISVLSRMGLDRLFRKRKWILGLLDQCKGDWNELFFRFVVMNFGFKTNNAAFELLARSMPYKYIKIHSNVKLQVYALFFGQAGLLNEEMNDDYYDRLRSEYHYLQYKYRLAPIQEKNWNYLRLRPRNFPALRLAQLSELWYHHPDFLKELLENPCGEIASKLTEYSPDIYWKTHYRFGKTTPPHEIKLGAATADLLWINAVIPLLFSYGTFHGNEDLKEKALSMLEEIHFEDNKITRIYKKAGFPCNGALYSQAVMELHHYFCTGKKCLDCEIGCIILKKKTATKES